MLSNQGKKSRWKQADDIEPKPDDDVFLLNEFISDRKLTLCCIFSLLAVYLSLIIWTV